MIRDMLPLEKVVGAGRALWQIDEALLSAPSLSQL